MVTSQLATRLLCADAVHADLGPRADDPLAPASLPLLRSDVEVGLWAAGPGTDQDVEVDEVFLVLSGSGEVAFDDGTTIDLRPGSLVHLHPGDRTSWRVEERLRKVYVASARSAGGRPLPTGTERLLAVDATTMPLAGASRTGQWVIGGWPTAAVETVATVGSSRVAVWETTSGVAADIEQDEVLVVLAGTAAVRFEDGELVTLRPGLCLRLHEGERTEWQVSSDLRCLTTTW